jgi:hypothetical protein
VPRQTIPITIFTLCEAEPGSDVDVRARPETDWLPAIVPGGVHEALLAAGRIADPYGQARGQWPKPSWSRLTERSHLSRFRWHLKAG